MPSALPPRPTSIPACGPPVCATSTRSYRHARPAEPCTELGPRSVPAGRDACNRLCVPKEHSGGESNSAGKETIFTSVVLAVCHSEAANEIIFREEFQRCGTLRQ